ncbi:MAG TPA: hypothetical protein VG347_25650 [Verrucomicrobiae bacterium]|nr:hypothetical protein [Verrucomicrobiae bacterium]
MAETCNRQLPRPHGGIQILTGLERIAGRFLDLFGRFFAGVSAGTKVAEGGMYNFVSISHDGQVITSPVLAGSNSRCVEHWLQKHFAVIKRPLPNSQNSSSHARLLPAPVWCVELVLGLVQKHLATGTFYPCPSAFKLLSAPRAWNQNLHFAK